MIHSPRPCSRGTITAALGLGVCIACSSSTSTDIASGPLAVGTWGGDSGAMIVGDTAIHLHIGCTFGEVSGRIEPGASGQFSANGSYVLRAFPIQVGPSLPAHFLGRRSGNTVTISVAVNDTVSKVTVVRGPVVVTLDDAPRQLPCPICRDPYGMARRSGVAVSLQSLR